MSTVTHPFDHYIFRLEFLENEAPILLPIIDNMLGLDFGHFPSNQIVRLHRISGRHLPYPIVLLWPRPYPRHPPVLYVFDFFAQFIAVCRRSKERNRFESSYATRLNRAVGLYLGWRP